MAAASPGTSTPIWKARRMPILAPSFAPNKMKDAMANVPVVRAVPTDVAGMFKSWVMPVMETLKALNDSCIWHIMTMMSGSQLAFVSLPSVLEAEMLLDISYTYGDCVKRA